MTDLQRPKLAADPWDLLVPAKNDLSATVNFHFHWKSMALRKIHDATPVQGLLSILLVPVPLLGYTAAQQIAIAAANMPRPEAPEAPPPAGSTAAVLAAYSAAFTYQRYNDDIFNRLQDIKNSLKDKMLASIDQTTLDHIFPVREEILAATFASIFIRLDTHFRHITAAHLTAVEAEIKAPFLLSSPNSLDDHVAKHVHLSRGLVAASQPQTETMKTNALRHSLLASPYAATFKTFLDIYDAAHRTVDAQSFDDMALIVSSAIPELLANLAATTVQSQYGANGAATPNSNTKARRPIGNRPAAWCWTHGSTFHASHECRSKAPGHQNKATAANKMGSKAV